MLYSQCHVPNFCTNYYHRQTRKLKYLQISQIRTSFRKQKKYCKFKRIVLASNTIIDLRKAFSIFNKISFSIFKSWDQFNWTHIAVVRIHTAGPPGTNTGGPSIMNGNKHKKTVPNIFNYHKTTFRKCGNIAWWFFLVQRCKGPERDSGSRDVQMPMQVYRKKHIQ